MRNSRGVRRTAWRLLMRWPTHSSVSRTMEAAEAAGDRLAPRWGGGAKTEG